MNPTDPQRDEESAPLVIPFPPDPVPFETATVGGNKVVVNKFIEGPGFADDEVFIDQFTAQKKEYSSEAPRIPEVDTAFLMGVLVNTIFLIYLMMVMSVLYSIYMFYQYPETRGKFIVLAWMINTFIVMAALIYLRWKVPRFFTSLNRSLASDILSAACTFIAAIGFFLYLDSIISAQAMVYFFVAPVAMGLADFVLIILTPGFTTMSSALPNFIMAIQNLIFALNIAYFHDDEWSLILLVYLVTAVIIMVYSSIMCVFTVVMFFVWLFKLRPLFNDYVISFFAMNFLAFLSGIGFLIFFMFIGFRRLLENHNIFVENPQTEHLDKFLLRVVIAGMWFLGTIFVVNFILSFFVARKVRSKYMYKVVSRKVLIYKEKLLMRVALVGKDYFKKESELKEGDARAKFEKCFICETRTANCVLYPCAHSGFCLECLREDQAKRDSCMICKQPVFKAKRIHFEEDDGVFYSTLEERYN